MGLAPAGRAVGRAVNWLVLKGGGAWRAMRSAGNFGSRAARPMQTNGPKSPEPIIPQQLGEAKGAMLEALKKFAEKSFCAENLKFVAEVALFEAAAPRQSSEELHDSLKALYVKFIQENAEFQVNIKSPTRAAFEKLIGKGTDTDTLSVMEVVKAADEEIQKLFNADVMPRFARSVEASQALDLQRTSGIAQ